MAVRQTADEAFNERYDGTGAQKRDTSDTNRRMAGRGGTRRDSTRNVRTEVRRSTMPGAPKNESFVSDKRDIATDFNASYATRGIQPSYAPANTNEAPSKNRYQQPEQITRSERYTKQQEDESQGMVPRGQKTQKRRKVIRKKHGAKSTLAKARVTGVNVWVWAWGLWSWFFFQLPFALISLFFAALTQFVFELFVERSVFKSSEPGLWASVWNVIVDGVVSALSVAASVVVSIAGWFGIDLSVLAPANFFALTYLITLVIGWFTLMLIYFQYKMAFLNPLGGEKGGMKMGFFLLALIGYATPIANIFPWFIFWTMAVWWHPK